MLVKENNIFVNENGLMRYIFCVLILAFANSVVAQTVLTIEGKTYTNSDASWIGVNIARSVPTLFTFRNNSITSVNTTGYMLQAGDEGVASTNNNLAGEIITGNKFIWKGTDMKSITHGLFTGQNINALIKYNYLDRVPMGIIRKSANNMVNTAGGVAYNIVKSGAVGINIKGMSNVNIYNNTLYTDRTTSETWRGLIYIYTHIDVTPNSVSHGTKIYNNIFYTKYQTYCIHIEDAESTIGFESDYNIFYCETGSPLFYYCGSVKTFAQWQALGYDTHSRVINPNFKDFINFVPAARLDYGTDLGSEWAKGLSVNARWGTTDPETAQQNGKWQVGAVIYKEVATTPAPAPVPVYTGSAINESAPGRLEMTYSLTLANIVPAASAFTVKVNNVTRNVSTVAISGTKVLITLASPVVFGDAITVAYTKPSTNPLQTAEGGQAASLTAQNVTNSRSAPVNQPPAVSISSPTKSTAFISPATVTIDAVASDPDGTVSRVEFYNGSVKLGERTAAPWSFTWKEVQEGTYSLTAAATDNSNSRTVSGAVTVVVEKAAPAINQVPSVAIATPMNNGSFEAPAIITLTASASDNDGSVVKVEYFSGQNKIGESLTPPYSFSFKCDTAGTYEITAVVSDNLYATATSAPVSISVIQKRQYADLINLYPNPNDGHFTIDTNSLAEYEDIAAVKIVSLSGRTVYNEAIASGETSKQIDISTSFSGNYIIIITNHDGILTSKQFIKN